MKSSSRLKDHYLDDIALQTFVLRGAGITVASIELLHVNTEYMRGPCGISSPDFFARLDVGDAVAERLVDLPGNLPAMRDWLAMTDPPAVEPGSQCWGPYGCEFYDRCTADKPDDWVAYLPRLSQLRADELKVLGIEAISAIPADFPLRGNRRSSGMRLPAGSPTSHPISCICSMATGRRHAIWISRR